LAPSCGYAPDYEKITRTDSVLGEHLGDDRTDNSGDGPDAV